MLRKTYKICVLLMRSDTIISRLIGNITGDMYTHASLSLDENCSEMYSFARIYHHLIFPGGFVREYLNKGVMGDCTDSSCTLLELSLDETEYNRVRSEVSRFTEAKRRIPYDMIGPLRCYFGKTAKKQKGYFCSQFVAEVLSNARVISPQKDPSLYKPIDFLSQKELTSIYVGTIRDLRKKYQIQAYKKEIIDHENSCSCGHAK